MVIGTIKELYKYRNMIISFTKSEVRNRYKGSVLGVLWSLLNPLFLLVVYGFVFSILMRGRIENYFLFLFAGLLPWIFFRSSILMSSNCIIGNASLVKKVYFPREILPLATVLDNLVNFFMGLIILVVALLIFGQGLSFYVIWLPVIIFVQFILNLSLALIFSAITVYLRDIRYILEVLTMALFYYTPILYKIDMIPETYRSLFYLNPMASMVQAYRDILFHGIPPQIYELVYIFIYSFVLLIVGNRLFRRMNRSFAEKI